MVIDIAEHAEQPPSPRRARPLSQHNASSLHRQQGPQAHARAAAVQVPMTASLAAAAGRATPPQQGVPKAGPQPAGPKPHNHNQQRGLAQPGGQSSGPPASNGQQTTSPHASHPALGQPCHQPALPAAQAQAKAVAPAAPANAAGRSASPQRQPPARQDRMVAASKAAQPSASKQPQQQWGMAGMHRSKPMRGFGPLGQLDGDRSEGPAAAQINSANAAAAAPKPPPAWKRRSTSQEPVQQQPAPAFRLQAEVELVLLWGHCCGCLSDCHAACRRLFSIVCSS